MQSRTGSRFVKFSIRPSCEGLICFDQTPVVHYRQYCTPSEPKNVCKQCNKDLEEIWICSTCSRLRVPTRNDYFSLLSLKPSFDVSHNLLQKTYGELKAASDIALNKETTEETKKFAEELDNALSTLETPLNRAKYLLEIQNKAEEVYAPDPEFFSAIAELQAEIHTNPADDATLTKLMKNACKATATYRDEIAAEFAKEDTADTIQIGNLIGRLEWTFLVIDQISTLLHERGGETTKE